MKIPIPYQVILKRMYDSSFKGELNMKTTRRILTFYSRIPKNMIAPILNEMKSNEWIKINGRDSISILQKVDCTILYRHPGRKEYNGQLI